jgi:hypothetical protein
MMAASSKRGFLKASLLWLEVEAASWRHSEDSGGGHHVQHVQESTFIAINLGLIISFQEKLIDY